MLRLDYLHYRWSESQIEVKHEKAGEIILVDFFFAVAPRAETNK